MSETVEQLIGMARAAERDDRLSSGALYGKLARALAMQHTALDKLVIIIRNSDQSEYEAKMLTIANMSCDCYPWPDKCPYCGGQPERCQCEACRTDNYQHSPDCAVHNGPALPVGECNCRAFFCDCGAEISDDGYSIDRELCCFYCQP